MSPDFGNYTSECYAAYECYLLQPIHSRPTTFGQTLHQSTANSRVTIEGKAKSLLGEYGWDLVPNMPARLQLAEYIGCPITGSDTFFPKQLLLIPNAPKTN